MTAPKENLVRAVFPGVEVRDSSEGGMPTLTGHFATFDQWTRIDSVFEGRFLERIAPGAFKKTLAEGMPKVLFQHGADPQTGNKPLGVPTLVEEDERGGYYEVPLLDTAYNRDLIPGLKAGAYGASFRFSVVKEDWNQSPERSAYNEEGLPERTLKEVRLMEFGPVTFPVYSGATAGVRSMTDEFVYSRDQLEALLKARALPEMEPTAVTPPEEPPDPPRAEPTVTPDPLKSGSLDSEGNRSVTTPSGGYMAGQMATPSKSLELHPVEQEARITELETGIRAQAESQRGIPSVEEQARWDADTAELNDLKAARAVRVSRAALFGTLSTTAEQTNTETTTYAPFNVTVNRGNDIYDMGQYGPGQVRSIDERDQKLRDNAMRSLESSSFAGNTFNQSRAKEGVQELLNNKDSRDKQLANRILLTGSPQYKREFAMSLANGRPTQFLNDVHDRAAALAVTGTTTTGGYMLPYTFDPTFIKTGAWTNINPFRVVCRVEQIVGSNNWQGVSVGAVPAIFETEALAVTEAGPTFARPSLTAQRASAYVTVSYETLQDRPTVVDDIVDLIQEGKDTLEEAQFAVGAGSTVYPAGMFLKSTFTVKETITNDTFAVADLDATEADLPIRHRRDAIWGFSRGVIRIIQGWETAYGKLFNSTLGYPAVGDPKNNPGGNTGLSLLGYPVWEFPSSPVTVTTDDTIVGILVAPKNYMILDRIGMNVDLIQNTVNTNGLPTGQRAILALWRTTGKALNADAGRQVNIN